MVARVIEIYNCNSCPHWDHSGSYTRGGAKPCCDHNDAVKRGEGKKDPYHWHHRLLREDGKIPGWCPLHKKEEKHNG